jgi:hypothetical protein
MQGYPPDHGRAWPDLLTAATWVLVHGDELAKRE